MKTKIDFKLKENGHWSQFCFNDYNEQDYLLEYNDTMCDQELIELLEQLVNKKIIQPKKCKGTIEIDKEGTMKLKFRYYSRKNDLLEKEVHNRTLTLHEWS